MAVPVLPPDCCRIGWSLWMTGLGLIPLKRFSAHDGVTTAPIKGWDECDNHQHGFGKYLIMLSAK